MQRFVAVPRGDSLVASVDSVVEGRHFKPGWLSPREIGYRAVAAALSDLAAMAARPLGVLVAMSIPDAWRAELDSLADGIGDAVSGANTYVLGGNLSDGTELSITTTVLGSAFAPLARGGARIGDRVYVTGRLGAPRARAASGCRAANLPASFRERFAHPAARLDEARWLADRGATSAIDISDGLIADVRQLRAASGVRIAIDAARVPCVAGRERRDGAIEWGRVRADRHDAETVRRRRVRAAVLVGTDGDRPRRAWPPPASMWKARALPPVGARPLFPLMRSLFVGLIALLMTAMLGPVVIVARTLSRTAGPAVDLRALCSPLGPNDQLVGGGSRARPRASGCPPARARCSSRTTSAGSTSSRSPPKCHGAASSPSPSCGGFRCSASRHSVAGIVFIDRDNRKQAFESYEQAAGEVQRGRAIIVCPEGTRGFDYHLRPFKKGPFVFAIAAQAPVIPTIVYGAREVMPKGSFSIRSGVDRSAFSGPHPHRGSRLRVPKRADDHGLVGDGRRHPSSIRRRLQRARDRRGWREQE